MKLLLVRLLFILVFGLIGYQIGSLRGEAIYGLFFGTGVGFLIILKDRYSCLISHAYTFGQDKKGRAIILDTSAIIDGRIGDIIKTGFLNERIIVPRFVLKELQLIADSTDPTKRQRGRRGFEILTNLQKKEKVNIIISEKDFPGTKEVDSKLVRMAKDLGARILTVDFNLTQVASIQGVGVLNINELANSLRLVVFPGENLMIKLIRDGKEHNQAVGYLDDGTMVVVEDARRLIGQDVKVCVTSVLQTPAGRMIFSKLQH